MANLNPNVYSYNPAFGGKPEVPDPVSSALKAILGTGKNLGDITALGDKINEFLTGQYTGRVQNYDKMSELSSGNITAALKGELPQDVLDLIGQKAAERGIQRGVPGSQLSNADYLKALGLTSLGLKQYGETALTGATKRLDAVKQFDPMAFATSPEDAYKSQLDANTKGAAPDPTAAYNKKISDLKAGATTNPGRSYTNLTGSGGGGRSAWDTNPYLNPTPNFSPTMATGPDWGKPAPVSTYNPWSLNPSGQFTWGGGAGIPESGASPNTGSWYDWTGSDYVQTDNPSTNFYVPPPADTPTGRDFDLNNFYGDETNWDDTLWFGE